VKARCLPTELWLCKTYGQCAVGLDAGPPPDAAPADAAAPDASDAPVCVGTACVEDQGCDCRLGGRGRPGTGGGLAGLLVALGLALAGLRRSSGRRGSRGGGTAGSGPCPGPRTSR
jgi:hypothetical protein